MKILNGITVDGARYHPPVERPKWRLVDYFLEAAEQHPGSDVLLWENGEITGWRNDTAKVNIRKNPSYRPGRVWTKLSPRKRQLIIDKVESAPTAIKAFLKKVHRHGKIALLTRKNPFRKLRPYKGGLTAAQLLDQAESHRESAALHRFSPTHRRHDLLWARTLRKKAYYTPKRRKKA